MKKMNLGLVLVFTFLILGSCGGKEEAAAVEDKPVATKKAHNPLAKEQQLIRDAQSLQGILDQDADKKKKAADNIN